MHAWIKSFRYLHIDLWMASSLHASSSCCTIPELFQSQYGLQWRLIVRLNDGNAVNGQQMNSAHRNSRRFDLINWHSSEFVNCQITAYRTLSKLPQLSKSIYRFNFIFFIIHNVIPVATEPPPLFHHPILSADIECARELHLAIARRGTHTHTHTHGHSNKK